MSVCLALTLYQTVEHIKLLSPPGKPVSPAFCVKTMLQNAVGQTSQIVSVATLLWWSRNVPRLNSEMREGGSAGY